MSISSRRRPTLPALCALLALAFNTPAHALSLVKTGDPVRLAGGPPVGKGTIGYAYGPTIMKTQGAWHAWYCSTGPGNLLDWDHVRYVNASTLDAWNPGVGDLIQPAPFERAACDPSAIRFDAGDGLYYYVAYSGNVANVQTVNFIARAKQPHGPFEKLTDANTWATQPPNAKVIVTPKKPAAEGSNIYGAGQPSLVVKDGKVYQYFTDVTAEPSGIWLTTSSDMKTWSAPVFSGLGSQYASVDVKYDDAGQQFVVVALMGSHTKDVYTEFRTSSDGLKWGEPNVFCDAECTPDYANNVGISGDENGHLIGDELLVAYGAPPGLAKTDTWGRWDLMGQRFEIVQRGKIKGHIDRVAENPATIDGWACGLQMDDSIDVHAYVGGPAGTGTMIGGVAANRASEDAVAKACEANGKAYRFSVPLTKAVLDKHPGERIYVHGLSKMGGANDLIEKSGELKLPGTPARDVASGTDGGVKTPTLPTEPAVDTGTTPPVLDAGGGSGKVIGYLDGVSDQNVLRGWACGEGRDESIDVHVYAGGPAGIGRFVTGAGASKGSEPQVAVACKAHGSAYRFEIPLTAEIISRYGGQPLYVHGISKVGGPNDQIAMSGSVMAPTSGGATPAPETVVVAPVVTTPAKPEPAVTTPAPTNTAEADKGKEAETVLRFYNPLNGDHLFTTSAAEALGAGYVSENVGFRTIASGSTSAATKTLYRCYDGRNHYVSGDGNCGGAGKKEGSYGTIYQKQESGTVALFGLRNAITGGQLVTTNPAEIESAKSAGYDVELGGQPLGYVLPPYD